MRLKEKEEELQLLKQHAEREKQEAYRKIQEAEREKEELHAHLLEMVTKRDQEHKMQLESVKREMDRQKQNTLTMQDVCMLYYFCYIFLAMCFASYHMCRSTGSSWNWRKRSWRQSWKWKGCYRRRNC